MATATQREIYYNAIHADQGYSEAIQDAFGPKATRWTVEYADKMRIPAVAQAYDYKRQCDDAVLAMLRESR